jgi:hypothetical protein
MNSLLLISGIIGLVLSFLLMTILSFKLKRFLEYKDKYDKVHGNDEDDDVMQFSNTEES